MDIVLRTYRTMCAKILNLEAKPESYIYKLAIFCKNCSFDSYLREQVHYLLEITAIFVYLTFPVYLCKSCNICSQILFDAIHLILNLKEQLRFLPNKIT